MQRANGNPSSAARMLGISRAQLAYRLQRRTGKSTERWRAIRCRTPGGTWDAASGISPDVD
ncbi:helix-turn-helix domain-containing protein [Burkholderia metallica]|uniref:helix-turn-helix domain-containing protein n=1 Tax=Burkholderia metallica TaxID=488729 RepID=UPI00349FDA74